MNTSFKNIQALLERPYDYNFYQAVSIIEQFFLETDAPDKPIRHRLLRFNAPTRFVFPPSDVIALEKKDIHGHPVLSMDVAFMGLTGPFGPLPDVYSEMVFDTTQTGNNVLQDFLDIFHHRLIHLMYQARKKRCLTLDLRPPEQSRFSNMLYSFCGLKTKDISSNLPISRRNLLYFTNLFLMKHATLNGLQTLISTTYQVSVELKPCIGSWWPIAELNQSCIGMNRGKNQVLGQNVVLGKQVWLSDSGIEINLHVTSYEHLISFLPGEKNFFDALKSLIRFYTREQFKIFLYFSIPTPSIQCLPLHSKGVRLGWTSWLHSQTGHACYQTRIGPVHSVAFNQPEHQT